MTERIRELERAHAADPSDLVALRSLADERKRRGLELLPDVRRVEAWSTTSRRIEFSSQWTQTPGGASLNDLLREAQDVVTRRLDEIGGSWIVDGPETRIAIDGALIVHHRADEVVMPGEAVPPPLRISWSERSLITI